MTTRPPPEMCVWVNECSSIQCISKSHTTHGSQCAQVTTMISHWREQDKIQKLYIGIERVIDVNELDK